MRNETLGLNLKPTALLYSIPEAFLLIKYSLLFNPSVKQTQRNYIITCFGVNKERRERKNIQLILMNPLWNGSAVANCVKLVTDLYTFLIYRCYATYGFHLFSFMCEMRLVEGDHCSPIRRYHIIEYVSYCTQIYWTIIRV